MAQGLLPQMVRVWALLRPCKRCLVRHLVRHLNWNEMVTTNEWLSSVQAQTQPNSAHVDIIFDRDKTTVCVRLRYYSRMMQWWHWERLAGQSMDALLGGAEFKSQRSHLCVAEMGGIEPLRYLQAVPEKAVQEDAVRHDGNVCCGRGQSTEHLDKLCGALDHALVSAVSR